jgi:hypothetical protein
MFKKDRGTIHIAVNSLEVFPTFIFKLPNLQAIFWIKIKKRDFPKSFKINELREKYFKIGRMPTLKDLFSNM